MKTYFYQILSLLLFFSCKSTKNEWYLIKNLNKISKYSSVLGYTSGYINKQGDTVVPLDKYARCYTDTVRDYAIVFSKEIGLIGIDISENKLFNAVWSLESVPMKESEGYILITNNGKYGYANNKGKVIIEPIYKCAENFYDGKAKVSNDCQLVKSEFRKWKYNSWYYINKKGKRITKEKQ